MSPPFRKGISCPTLGRLGKLNSGSRPRRQICALKWVCVYQLQGRGEDDVKFKVLQWDEGNCTKLLFLFCASEEGCDACYITCVNSCFNLFLSFFSVSLLLSLNLFFRPSTTLPGRKLRRKEGRKEGTREQNGQVHNSLEIAKNEGGRRRLWHQSVSRMQVKLHGQVQLKARKQQCEIKEHRNADYSKYWKLLLPNDKVTKVQKDE